MAAELRWILLGLSLPLLAGIWWWTARRSSQAPGNPELRESTAGKTAEPATAAAPNARYADPDEHDARPPREADDWGVAPFEPLNIRTADFEHVPALDRPMMVDAEAIPLPEPAMPAAPVSAAPVFAPWPVVAPTPVPAPWHEVAPQSVDSPPPPPTAAELQRIVTVRVCTVGEGRWSGEQLMAALELHGLAFGRYQVFHRRHADGRSLFCVASLIEPGTFDFAEMADQEFRGITLFAILPGPMAPLDTLDELIRTARGLAEELSGMVQDAKGMPLSPQRAAALREDLARFQASLAGN